ncbi:EAL domain-containing protein [Nitrogeniibacter mangrovi]|uniref:EAL domain-containing protein n=1 Tax=Nitrogeniibacter mangrovi TaxID=2016596 RepID=A0A6C1B7X4_9RHOO|nr:bifunctional diguanylate cyclase/phosphodiesterase [Nitrogeniibacter mangrovi]QID18915.1 EAL domain-containing protein [Nitrogeniibacter mangrovi]
MHKVDRPGFFGIAASLIAGLCASGSSYVLLAVTGPWAQSRLVPLLGSALVGLSIAGGLAWGQRRGRHRSRPLPADDAASARAQIDVSEARFRDIFEQAAVGIALCDADGVVEQANARFLDLVGRNTHETVGRRLETLLGTPETTAPHPFEHATASWRCRRADETDVWLQVSRTPCGEGTGQALPFIATVQDITHLHGAAAALAEEEHKLRAVLGTLGEGVIMRDADGRVVLHNTAAARIFGLDDADTAAFHIGSGQLRFVREDGEPHAIDEFPSMQTLRDGEAHSGVVGVARRDGSTRWLWVHSKAIMAPEGTPSAVVSSIADITRMREAETRLRLADRAIDHSADAIMITTAEGLILRVNPAFTRITGYSADEVIGHTPALLRSGQHEPAFYATLWESIRRTGSWQGDIWNRHKDGSLFAERLSISAVRDASGRLSHYVAVFSDVTEARAKEQRALHMAHHDPLTGLPNRNLMADRLERALSRATRDQRQVVLMFLDLDRFKEVNDSHGHAVGDALLKGVARRLEDCVRDSDSVARQAGDEFLILLPDLEDGGRAGQVAAKILSALSAPVAVEGRHIAISASIGIALFPTDARDADTLLAHADTALYHAKGAGRNTFRYFTESMNAEAERRQRVEQQLRAALAHDRLQLAFQPLRHLADGRIVAMEILCRWRDSLFGDIDPAHFVAETGDVALLEAIDRWTLARACREAARWHAAGAGVPVAVNVSARHFRRDSLVDIVGDALADAGLPAAQLEIEMPERILHDPDPQIATTLNRLKRLGVRLVVDEFGTGCDSLTRLKAYGIDRLKMDRSLTAGLEDSPDQQAIMNAMIALGHHLDIEVLAEGVDTAGQHDRIMAAGCRLGQGRLLDAPMNPAAALDRLKSAAAP